MTDTSVSLLERLRSHPDSSCWRQLTEVYEPLIRDWLQRHATPVDEQDDLVQEVLVIVMKKLPQFEHNHRTGAFRSWLRMITVNCLRDFWKTRRLRPTATGGSDFQRLLVELEDPESSLSREWDQQHDRRVMQRILARIKGDFAPQTWRAFLMLTLEELPASDVAASLGMTTNAVYAAKSRVMTTLRHEANGIIDCS